jgi:hypothetical protein
MPTSRWPRQAGDRRQKFNAQGVLAGSKDASRCIGYLTKRLDDGHQAATGDQHAQRLSDAPRYELCSSEGQEHAGGRAHSGNQLSG